MMTEAVKVLQHNASAVEAIQKDLNKWYVKGWDVDHSYTYTNRRHNSDVPYVVFILTTRVIRMAISVEEPDVN